MWVARQGATIDGDTWLSSIVASFNKENYKRTPAMLSTHPRNYYWSSPPSSILHPPLLASSSWHHSFLHISQIISRGSSVCKAQSIVRALGPVSFNNRPVIGCHIDAMRLYINTFIGTRSAAPILIPSCCPAVYCSRDLIFMPIYSKFSAPIKGNSLGWASFVISNAIYLLADKQNDLNMLCGSILMQQTV